MNRNPSTIIDFWFDNKPNWFLKDPEFDALIKKRFFAVYNKAINNELDSWKREAEDILSLILILDQFPRNMFRDTPKAFSGDKLALECAKEAMKKEFRLLRIFWRQIYCLSLPW